MTEPQADESTVSADLRLSQRLRGLAAAATPGPWAVPVANVFRVIAPDQPHINEPMGMTPPYPWRIVAEMGVEETAARDAAFIAACDPGTITALLDRLDALEAVAEGDTWAAQTFGEAS